MYFGIEIGFLYLEDKKLYEEIPDSVVIFLKELGDETERSTREFYAHNSGS